jgi:hypothetical protein
MMMNGEKRHGHESPEEIAEILSVVSDKVPGLIKGLVRAVFSEETARDMAKAAATYYKELKAGGFPDDLALHMTQEYVSVFTKIGDVIKAARESEHDDDLKRVVKEKIKRELEKD